jgi:hypothetical protein
MRLLGFAERDVILPCLVLWRTVVVNEIIKGGEGKFVHVMRVTHKHSRLHTRGKPGGRSGRENSVEKVRKHFDYCTSQN